MKLKFLPALMLFVSGCSIYPYTLDMEMRQSSDSGLQLYGKSMAVVYVDDGHGTDSTFINPVADKFAAQLEESYFDADSIGMYKVSAEAGKDYSRKESIVPILLELDADVIFLFDRPAFDFQQDETNMLCKMYAFDSMNKAGDKVYVSNLIQKTGRYSISDSEAGELAGKLALPYQDVWKMESITIYCCESMSSDWENALAAAYEGRWMEACELWMGLSVNKIRNVRAAASYNTSVALYMMGNYELAKEWLDLADESSSLPNSPSMRKRINEKL